MDKMDKRMCGEYQRNVSDFVSREVSHCVSTLISSMCDIAGNLGRADADTVDIETLWALQRREPDDDDRREALASEGYTVCEDEHEGCWYVIDSRKLQAMKIHRAAMSNGTFYAATESDEEAPDFSGDLASENEARLDYIQTHGDALSADDESEALREACDLNNVEADSSEVYEHWIVSSWLGEKLAEKGECVHEWQSLTIWGRCTTGQAIAMDGVICRIYDELHSPEPAQEV